MLKRPISSCDRLTCLWNRPRPSAKLQIDRGRDRMIHGGTTFACTSIWGPNSHRFSGAFFLQLIKRRLYPSAMGSRACDLETLVRTVSSTLLD